jgi:hypothetical protein
MKQNEKARGQGTVARKNRLVSLTAGGEFSGFAVAKPRACAMKRG